MSIHFEIATLSELINAELYENIEALEKNKSIKVFDPGDNPIEVHNPMVFDEDDQLNFLETQKCTRKLKVNAAKLGVPVDDAIHLECFATSLRAAKGKKINPKKKANSIHDFFKSKPKNSLEQPQMTTRLSGVSQKGLCVHV